MDKLRQAQVEKVLEALDMGEIETGKGLTQEHGLARAANTCWGSHYKYFKNFISMFGSIIDVHDTIVVDSESVEEKAKTTGYLRTYLQDDGWDPLIKNVSEFCVRFSNLKGLGDLSEELVKTKKYFNYPFVFRLVKFALLLPVATTIVERAFSAMKLIKSELRNQMDDGFMSSCMVPYVEKKI
ncbi:uncharacterized protein LOC124896718 [Capsicum annuum]|uniref:uncharacterized protein LOC124896718 n=1 Tax=Capsicum annuum TaxID=4072 RepID=UPI001FB0AC64|nr:uncharacterized protein LOC124896718 [Capsicum annuum]